MSADADTEPLAPESPAPEPLAPESPAPEPGDPGRGGVVIPGWLAGALVVVLALLIAGAGFAIGRATAPDEDGLRPIVATEGGGRGSGPGGGSGELPGRGGPRRGPGGLPGFPGGPQGPGGDGEGPHAGPGSPGGRDRTGDDSGDDSSDTPAPPQLPGT